MTTESVTPAITYPTTRYEGALTMRPLPFDDPEIDALSPELRAEVALHWQTRAASERRVGLAFAFVKDTLRDAGAPDTLISLATRAVDDERRHTELARQVASRYAGHDVGDRWMELAAAWDAHADGSTYPFNDWHAVMSYLGAGRQMDVERLTKAYRENDRAVSESAGWGRATARPLIGGFSAFWQGDYRAAVELLHPVRFIANAFGGSHAQRDVIDWTLTEAALRGGLRDVAESLAHERLALKPHSPVNRAFLGRARDADGAKLPTA